MANSKYEYVKAFEAPDNLMPSTWIVVRIDSCHFHRFSEIHEFEKPNDENALKLMNSSAVALFEEFPDIVFAYGVSDEYSFVLKKSSQLYERRASKILSLFVSLFSSTFVMKWKEFFPEMPLQYVPYFDGRVVCYPSKETLLDYLAWRQVDCHINNQYNTCFWKLVESGKSKTEAQELLKGTQTAEKNELLFHTFEINYNDLPAIFRKGSCVFREVVDEIVKHDKAGLPVTRPRRKILVDHCDIIGKKFWSEHPGILPETKQAMDIKPTVALRAALVGALAAFAKVAGAVKAAGGAKVGAAAAAMTAAAMAAVSGSKGKPDASKE